MLATMACGELACTAAQASEARQRQAGPSQEEAFPELRAQVRSVDDNGLAQEARPAPVRR